MDRGQALLYNLDHESPETHGLKHNTAKKKAPGTADAGFDPWLCRLYAPCIGSSEYLIDRGRVL